MNCPTCGTAVADPGECVDCFDRRVDREDVPLMVNGQQASYDKSYYEAHRDRRIAYRKAQYQRSKRKPGA